MLEPFFVEHAVYRTTRDVDLGPLTIKEGTELTFIWQGDGYALRCRDFAGTLDIKAPDAVPDWLAVHFAIPVYFTECDGWRSPCKPSRGEMIRLYLRARAKGDDVAPYYSPDGITFERLAGDDIDAMDWAAGETWMSRSGTQVSLQRFLARDLINFYTADPDTVFVFGYEAFGIHAIMSGHDYTLSVLAGRENSHNETVFYRSDFPPRKKV